MASRTVGIGASPSGSDSKESACNAGNPGLIPGLGRSAGEGIRYPLQYSWGSLVAQLINLLQYSSLENSMDCIVHGVTKNQTQLSGFHLLEIIYVLTAKIK